MPVMAASRTKPVTPRRKRPAAASAETAQDSQPLKIGGAARVLGVEAYVLRFWETQFPFLRPHHASSSHRIYQPRDLALLRMVKRLLHVEGYTIAGAKKHIREVGLERLCTQAASRGATPAPAPAPPKPPATGDDGREGLRNTLESIREDLQSLRKLLE